MCMRYMCFCIAPGFSGILNINIQYDFMHTKSGTRPWFQSQLSRSGRMPDAGKEICAPFSRIHITALEGCFNNHQIVMVRDKLLSQSLIKTVLHCQTTKESTWSRDSCGLRPTHATALKPSVKAFQPPSKTELMNYSINYHYYLS